MPDPTETARLFLAYRRYCPREYGCTEPTIEGCEIVILTQCREAKFNRKEESDYGIS